ncbi:hypothetical protein [Streptomyces caniscabiei]|uniref:AG1 protein n=1 Tax=Streptomyces caniscabiei TaxID=2746961 RepID=A0A927LFA8_9ACTN|nr:hypothetical protein [Streptomyces caniscabiei]MBD9730041.1 hypothetical protein [Streptomyces caniscabiei]MDX3515776.1 hypothetical protein [Streptomyces caniscabiei]MDX3724995.1 hypothetical protein [Streptomyces caniscabiei]WEO23773.1 hypothetical protein IHE65_11645 [Streptomyces caniscabiei]
MAWEEWEQLKADAEHRQSTGMQLNQAPAEGGGGKTDLVVHDDELGKLGNMAYDLRERFRVDADHARPSTFAASIDLFNDGLDTGSALTELHDAWNTQQQTLKEACAHISNHLDFSRAQHAKDDVHIQTGMRNAAGDLMTVSRINEYFK